MSLAGKVALITGASRGIGAAIARAFVAEGAAVAITYNANPDKANELVTELTGKGGQAASFKSDAGDVSQVATLVKAVLAKFSKIDILVNNAGIASGGKVDDPKLDTAGLATLWQVNVAGVIALTRAVSQVMPNGGRIINFGSCLGTRCEGPGLADYSATKAALAAYTRGIAHDLAPRNILVNCLAPGPIHTDMNPENGPRAPAQLAQVPLRRFGKVEEIAAPAVFLAGPGASYITGITLDVNGGNNA